MCTHSEASLSEGDVTDFKIECWLHGAEFDLRTGQALTLPANIAVKTYPVSIVDDVVEVQFTDK
jgi:3-phenylpropionate/trans-cinnamate dioxygenase ferredoxin subunit